uniref:Uncharacterized protein n=1 Tax=Setaria viridis TaxID=4556 RepID=A0A4V6D1D7_SETVI|nr:LOW QUALITY PROTEIN: hypothetical protein SEVIR_9G283900v2 [Setaria viridis]
MPPYLDLRFCRHSPPLPTRSALHRLHLPAYAARPLAIPPPHALQRAALGHAHFPAMLLPTVARLPSAACTPTALLPATHFSQLRSSRARRASILAGTPLLPAPAAQPSSARATHREPAGSRQLARPAMLEAAPAQHPPPVSMDARTGGRNLRRAAGHLFHPTLLPTLLLTAPLLLFRATLLVGTLRLASFDNRDPSRPPMAHRQPSPPHPPRALSMDPSTGPPDPAPGAGSGRRCHPGPPSMTRQPRPPGHNGGEENRLAATLIAGRLPTAGSSGGGVKGREEGGGRRRWQRSPARVAHAGRRRRRGF